MEEVVWPPQHPPWSSQPTAAFPVAPPRFGWEQAGSAARACKEMQAISKQSGDILMVTSLRCRVALKKPYADVLSSQVRRLGRRRHPLRERIMHKLCLIGHPEPRDNLRFDYHASFFVVYSDCFLNLAAHGLLWHPQIVPSISGMSAFRC